MNCFLLAISFKHYKFKCTFAGLWLNNKSFNNDLSRSIAVGGWLLPFAYKNIWACRIKSFEPVCSVWALVSRIGEIIVEDYIMWESKMLQGFHIFIFQLLSLNEWKKRHAKWTIDTSYTENEVRWARHWPQSAKDPAANYTWKRSYTYIYKDSWVLLSCYCT